MESNNQENSISLPIRQVWMGSGCLPWAKMQYLRPTCVPSLKLKKTKNRVCFKLKLTSKSTTSVNFAALLSPKSVSNSCWSMFNLWCMAQLCHLYIKCNYMYLKSSWKVNRFIVLKSLLHCPVRWHCHMLEQDMPKIDWKVGK